MVDKLKKEGKPFVLLDAGDALFRFGVPPAKEQKDKELGKADLVLQCLGELGYHAAAVGEKDLAYGYDALVAAAKKHKASLLSANLTRGGAPAFEARRVIKAGGIKIGVFGLSPAIDGALVPGVARTDPVEAARTQAAALKTEGAELVVALAHLDFAEAMDVLGKVADIDLMIQGHTSRVAQPQEVSERYLIASGERGRQMIRVDLNLVGNGRFTDLSQISDSKVQLQYVTSQIAAVRERMRTEPQYKAALEQTLTQLEQRREELQKISRSNPSGRTLIQTIVNLDSDVAFDAKWKDLVDKFVAKHGPTNQ